MLAVRAESTRIVSSPSRKTRTAMSRVAAVLLEFGVSGSGFPAAATPCQTRTAATASAESPRKTGIAPQSRRRAGAGGANTWEGAEGMLFTLTLMTSRPRLTKKQNNLPRTSLMTWNQNLTVLFHPDLKCDKRVRELPSTPWAQLGERRDEPAHPSRLTAPHSRR